MRLVAAAMVLGTVSGTSAAPQATSAPVNKEWYEPVDPLRIVGPIHYVGTRDLGVYLVTTPAGHVLLDGAMPGSGPLIEASIRKLGFKPEEIRVLLTSQAHADHVGTLAHFKKLSGGQLAVMEGDVALLKSGGALDYVFAKQPEFQFDAVAADRVLKDGDTVSLGGIELTARWTPGHTRGTTTWITTVEDAGRSYRVVFPGSLTVNPGTRLVHDPSYPGIADDYRRSIALLESLEPDVFLAAHGGFFDFDGKRLRAVHEGVRTWVDPEGYRDRIAGQKAAFEELVANEKAPPPGKPAQRRR